MFTFSSISRSLEFWSVNHTSIYENSESKGCKNFLTCLKYVTINQMIYLEQILQCINTTSVISKWGTFSPVWLYLFYF